MTADLKSLAHSRLRVRETRGVFCRAQQLVSGYAAECRQPGRERPPTGALVSGPALWREGRSRPGNRCRLSGPP